MATRIDNEGVGVIMSAEPVRRTVFLVHGRDEDARTALEALLRSFLLKVVSWRRAAALAGGGAPYTGDIVAAGMDHSDAVVVLLTPDDVGHLRKEFVQDGDGPHERNPTGQPRMNVIFEAGMALARDRNRVVLVEVGAVRRMTDTDGINVVRLDDSVSSRMDLGARLEAAGLTVDMEEDGWRTAGTFARTPLTRDHLTPADLDMRPPAPRPITTGEGLTRKQQAYQGFWRSFLDYVRDDERFRWMRSRTPPSANWMVLETVTWGEYVVSFGSGQRLRCELFIARAGEAENTRRFEVLLSQRAAIEREFGAPLTWEDLPGKQSCRVAFYAPGEVLNLDGHPKYVQWFAENITRLRGVLTPLTH